MLVGDGFSSEAFDMDKTAIVRIGGIALAAHATRAMLVQCFEILVNDLLRRFLPAGRHGERHNIPYHNAYSFGDTAGTNMALLIFKTLHAARRAGPF